MGVPMPCMGRPARSPGPPPPLASPHLNLRGLVFNFIKKIALAALSFFLLRIFFSRTMSFIDIDSETLSFLNYTFLASKQSIFL